MGKRQIIKIDENLCNGCGQCANGCPEGALQVIDGKARLVNEVFCDGLGACIGSCPVGAISTEEREAEAYNEKITMSNIVKAGTNTIRAHLDHLKHHGQTKLYNEAIEYLKENNIPIPYPPIKLSLGCTGNCPGSQPVSIPSGTPIVKVDENQKNSSKIASEMTQWPIQIKLLPVQAPFFDGADILVAADCVGFANPNFHKDLLKGKKLLVGCPKLDDSQFYIEKLGAIFAMNDIKSITTAIMEVPCCRGMEYIIKEALKLAKKEIPIKTHVYSLKGDRKS